MPSRKRRAEVMDGEGSRKKKRMTGNKSNAASTAVPKPEIIRTASPPAENPDLTIITHREGEHEKSLKLLHEDFDNLRQTLTCKICERLFYEPYVLACGHTYCYSCISSWFASNKKRPCPNCRVNATQPPAPCYAIKEMVNIFIRRAEILPDGETVEQHQEWQKEEADIVLKDKNNQDAGTGGLFKGSYQTAAGRPMGPIHDDADGVDRCPGCLYELEDGYCLNCGLYGPDMDSEMDAELDDYDEEMDDDEAIEQFLSVFVGEDTGQVFNAESGQLVAPDMADWDRRRRLFEDLIINGQYSIDDVQGAAPPGDRAFDQGTFLRRLDHPAERHFDEWEDEDDLDDDEDDGSMQDFLDDDGELPTSPMTISSEERDVVPSRTYIPATRIDFNSARVHHQERPEADISSADDTSDSMPQYMGRRRVVNRTGQASAINRGRRAARPIALDTSDEDEEEDPIRQHLTAADVDASDHTQDSASEHELHGHHVLHDLDHGGASDDDDGNSTMHGSVVAAFSPPEISPSIDDEDDLDEDEDSSDVSSDSEEEESDEE